MAKTILIPIDFKVESLITLKLALSDSSLFEDDHEFSKVNIVLIYAEYQSDSITDLLFYSAYKTIQRLKTPEFNDAISIIQNRYKTVINSISIELFHGCNSNAFENWVKSKNIDLSYIPKSYLFKPIKNGFNPIPFIKKSKLQYKEMDWELNSTDSNSNYINTLFI